MTHEFVIELLYGHSQLQMGQKTGAPDGDEFGHHLEAGNAHASMKLALGKWRWVIRSSAFSRHCKKVHQLVEYFMNARIRRKQRNALVGGQVSLRACNEK